MLGFSSKTRLHGMSVFSASRHIRLAWNLTTTRARSGRSLKSGMPVMDDDGTPFREKIYAVFPGFEPSLKQGKRGLHLLFLFDPEIGRDGYMRAFNLAMGGVSPWREKELQISSKSADDIFRELREFHRQECPIDEEQRPKWSYIALAPHIDNEKGLLAALNAQVLKNLSPQGGDGPRTWRRKTPRRRHEETRVVCQRVWLQITWRSSTVATPIRYIRLGSVTLGSRSRVRESRRYVKPLLRVTRVYALDTYGMETGLLTRLRTHQT